MANSISVSKSDIGERAFDVANLAGLLDQDGTLQTDWFADPAQQLEAAPGRAKALIQTLQAFLGPKAETGEPVFAGAEWYEIQNPSTGRATGFYLVTPPATDAGGCLGLGLAHPFSVGNLTVYLYLFVPLFDIENGADPAFVLANEDPAKVYPVKVGLDVSASVPLTPKGTSDVFTDFVVEADFTLDGRLSDAFRLDIEFRNKDKTLDQYSNLCEFIDAATTGERIGALIVQGMAYWLNLYVGSSGHTIGDLLVNANLLGTGKQGNFTYYQYDPAALRRIETDPLKAAENIAFAVLEVLADNQAPILPLPFLDPAAEKPNGEGQGDARNDQAAKVAGVWIAFEPDDPSRQDNHGSYGVRFMVPDIPIKLGSGPTAPDLHLRLGSWFSGEESDETGWVNAIVGAERPYKPGLSVFFLDFDGQKASFKPSFELTSVGFDLNGAKDTPLFNVKGVTLNGAELRTYINQPQGWQFGFGARLDGVGIPLGSGFSSAGSAGGNAVASGLVASGDSSPGESGGDAAQGRTDAVNPNFSLDAAYVSGKVAKRPWYVELRPPHGAAGDIVWFPIQRRFGPLACEKVGLSWNQSDLLLDLVLDGGVKLAGLSVDLVELSVGVALDHPTDPSAYHLGLKGLDVAFSGGAVEINGGFLQSGSGATLEYDGQASIRVAEFGIGAIGSFATLPGGGTSLFVFAFLDAPLGGVPAFFVTGLAAGFGFNRRLKTPAFDQVADFPLVKGVQDASAIGVTPGQTPDPGTVLTTLKAWVPPTRGEYWLAAGVRFTSFELINSNVLLVMEFGRDFEILILGTSTVQLPPAEGEVVFAFAELEIEVLIEPLAGVVEASAVLAPGSFVLNSACHLHGGFAFYLWFGPNPHAGDFVLTLGGYHPAFKRPDWYPDIPRLGFTWQVSDLVEISGGAYFTLTPSCIMAGGELKLLFHMGDIRAWFDACANMLIAWKPFFYDIDIGVSIGVSVKVHLLFIKGTIKIEVGADLEIWGPPTAGKAHVHLWIVSFTIGFGPAKSTTRTVTDWNGFKAMLPGGGSESTEVPNQARTLMLAALADTGAARDVNGRPVVCHIHADAGVTRTIEDGGGEVWVIDPAEFSFSVATTVPVTAASMNGTAIDLDVGSDYFVAARPMGVSALQTPLSIEVSGDQDADWQGQVDKRAVPEAVWGRPLAPGATPPAASDLLEGRVMGLGGIQAEPHPPSGPPVIDMAGAFTDVPVTERPATLPLSQTPVPAGAVPAPDPEVFTELGRIMDVQTSAERATLFAALGVLRHYAGSDGDLGGLAADPHYAYRDAPMTGSPLAS